MTVPFGSRLVSARRARGPLCVGIDPHVRLLQAWDLPVDVDGLRRFADTCVLAFGPEAAVVKPQSAFFEVFGSRGVAVLEDTVAALRQEGALVLLDVKRGDIGSTMAAYADAYLGRFAPVPADAITVSPYLGVDALQPAFDAAQGTGSGLFVLARTSNPEGAVLQSSRGRSGRTVAQTVVDEVAGRNAGATPLGSFGVVVGATGSDEPVDLAELHGPVLMPGVGAQGGTTADVRRIAGTALSAVLPTLSREILQHGPDVDALRTALRRHVESFEFLQG